MLYTCEILNWLKTASCNYDVSYNDGIIYFYIDDYHSFRVYFDANDTKPTAPHNDIETDFTEFIKYNHVISMCLAGSNFWSDDEDPDLQVNAQLSYELYLVLKKLNDVGCNYTDYELKQYLCDEYCSNMGCPELFEFCYLIKFDISIWQNIDTIKKLVCCVVVDWNVKSEYRNLQDMRYMHPEISLFSTNTKARRLGYIKEFIRLFDGNVRISEAAFEKRLYAKFDQHLSQLNDYINNKGVIQITKRNTGFQPYIDIANCLGFMFMRNNGYELSKYGQLYQKMLEHKNNAENAFQLSILDKSFFLESILSHDFMSVFLILEYSFINDKSNYHDLKNNFVRFAKHYIDSLMCYSEDNRDMNYLLLLKKRFDEWKKPDAYLEHIIMPRLNWLLDLELINLDYKLNYSLTRNGKVLFSHLSQWLGLSKGGISAPSYFIEHFFMKVFCETYCISVNTNLDFELYLTKYLDTSFEKFRTIAPNRVTYSHFTGYAKRMLLFNDAIAIDEYEIKLFLENHTDTYIFKYQQYYKDGYIQKK